MNLQVLGCAVQVEPNVWLGWRAEAVANAIRDAIGE